MRRMMHRPVGEVLRLAHYCRYCERHHYSVTEKLHLRHSSSMISGGHKPASSSSIFSLFGSNIYLTTPISITLDTTDAVTVAVSLIYRTLWSPQSWCLFLRSARSTIYPLTPSIPPFRADLTGCVGRKRYVRQTL